MFWGVFGCLGAGIWWFPVVLRALWVFICVTGDLFACSLGFGCFASVGLASVRGCWFLLRCWVFGSLYLSVRFGVGWFIWVWISIGFYLRDACFRASVFDCVL